MHMRLRTLAIATLVTVAGAASAQLPGRVFSPWTTSNASTWTFDPAYPAGAAGTTDTQPTNTFINVDPYVFVGGLFDQAITVSGMGSGTSITANSDIQVLTNMDLTFYMANFNAVDYIPNGSTSVPGPDSVTVNYVFQAWSNYSTGQTIDNTGSATGSIIGSDTLTVDNSTVSPQSATVALPLASTTDGVAALRIVRQVSLTGQAPGDAAYTSIGDVVVSIN